MGFSNHHPWSHHKIPNDFQYTHNMHPTASARCGVWAHGVGGGILKKNNTWKLFFGGAKLSCVFMEFCLQKEYAV